MARQEIDIAATTSATPAAVWRLLGDSATWPEWTPIDAHTEERPGDADGLGEVRAFKNGRVRVREEIVERVPEQHLAYTLLSGLAVRDYRAEIDLRPEDGGGTTIRWHTTFAAKRPWMGPVYAFALRKATQQFVDGLVEHAAAATNEGGG